MALLTDWLAKVEASALYPEEVLDELLPFGIRYRDGVLTSIRLDERPYPSYGRCASVPLMTPRELATAALEMRRGLELENPETDTLLVPGYEIVTACWRLFRPVTVGAKPPSAMAKTVEDKASYDIDALRRYGY